jgi:hypothetical protein
MRIYVDAEDAPEVRDFFTNFKQRVKDRLQQLDVWLTSHVIEVL